MAVKVAINGFGRIVRLLYRAALETDADIDFVAVNMQPKKRISKV